MRPSERLGEGVSTLSPLGPRIPLAPLYCIKEDNFMSIPNYEMDNLVSGEFWKFTKDDTCVGLPGQSINLPFVERLWMRLDKEADKREGAKNIQTFDEKLQPAKEIVFKWPKRKFNKPLFVSGFIQPYPS